MSTGLSSCSQTSSCLLRRGRIGSISMVMADTFPALPSVPPHQLPPTSVLLPTSLSSSSFTEHLQGRNVVPPVAEVVVTSDQATGGETY